MSQIGEENQVIYERLYRGGIDNGSVLPNQLLPKSKKTKAWKKTVLDSLEEEALRQYHENLRFKDYYDMVSGKMVYADVTGKDQESMFANMMTIKKEAKNLPSYLRHWDLMYPILSIFTGEQLLEEDKFRFDTTDEVSTNEFIREKTARLSKYSELRFQQELQKIMLIRGVEMGAEPSSEEEAAQMQQEIESEIEKYLPINIEADLTKNWKTKAAQWAERTWERDYERFRMKTLRYIETKDYLLTGRAPRHYRVGFKNYYPERFHPIETFHSKDDELDNYRDAEYAGRLKFYSISQLISRYGYYFSQKTQEKLSRIYYADEPIPKGTGSNSVDIARDYFQTQTVPFHGWSNYKQTMSLQENFNVSTVWEEDLTTGVKRPGYLPKLFGSTVPGMTNNLTGNLRNDFVPRTDTIATLESYFRGFKRVGIITYRSDSGHLRTIEVNEDLEKEVIEEYNLKNLRSISEIEYDSLTPDKKENTVIWKYVPIVYMGLKFNFASALDGIDDEYIVEELEYQIRGEKGNLEDLGLPIVGVIGEAPFEKIRPEQMMYNFYLNQNTQYIQKELGGFFAFDVTLFPTEFMGLSEKGENSLIKFRNFVKKTGLMPLDASKHNMMERGGSQFNTMMYQNVTFTDQIRRNKELADMTKWQAYEKLGITQTRVGTPSQYQSVEGVQIGQTASFAQTANITHVLNEDERIKIETHVTVAQHAQLKNKDENYIYVASDDEVSFLESIADDEWFDLRMISVRPLYNYKKKREVELLKQILLQNNTLGHDAYALSTIALSDDYLELMDASREARKYADQVREEDRRAAQESHERELEFRKEEQDLLRAEKEEDRKVRIKVAELAALGRVADNTNQADGTDIIIDQAEDFKLKELAQKREIEFSKISQRADEAALRLENEITNTELQKRQLDLKEKEIEANKFIAVINKN